MIDDSTYIVGIVNYVLFPGFAHTQIARTPADFISCLALAGFPRRSVKHNTDTITNHGQDSEITKTS